MLYLVRHGQASFGKEDYDQLSDLGYEQAKITGQYLSKTITPKFFVSGTLKRQRQTLTEIKKGFSPTDLNQAKSLELEEFNEFDHRNVLEVAYPNFRQTHRSLLESLLHSSDAVAEFQLLYKAAINKWIHNDGNYKEDFLAFTQRVLTGMNALASLVHEDESIILVSSAGPISSGMQFSMDLSADTAFLLCEEMRNASISAIKIGRDGTSFLSYFNNFQHLEYADTNVTYR